MKVEFIEESSLSWDTRLDHEDEQSYSRSVDALVTVISGLVNPRFLTSLRIFLTRTERYLRLPQQQHDFLCTVSFLHPSVRRRTLATRF